MLLFAFYSTTPSGKREKRGGALKSASDDDDAELSRAPYAFSQHVYWIDEPLFRQTPRYVIENVFSMVKLSNAGALLMQSAWLYRL